MPNEKADMNQRVAVALYKSVGSDGLTFGEREAKVGGAID